ncbi:glutathione S-transferase 1-1-like [Haliotis cracherodii]|uniref:glutathione S-transferase 1-1-like n=1 Tax=Haliotis cracherodii TaxID=6455 RepID=UPI0039E990FC
MDVEQDFEFIRYEPNDENEPDVVAAYRKDVNPHGTIPALVIPGEGTILESGAINMYLADRYGKLVPDPKDRKDYYDSIMYGNASLDGLIDFFYELWYKKAPFSAEKVKKMRDKFDACMDYLAKRLENRAFLCGSSLLRLTQCWAMTCSSSRCSMMVNYSRTTPRSERDITLGLTKDRPFKQQSPWLKRSLCLSQIVMKDQELSLVVYDVSLNKIGRSIL